MRCETCQKDQLTIWCSHLRWKIRHLVRTLDPSCTSLLLPGSHLYACRTEFRDVSMFPFGQFDPVSFCQTPSVGSSPVRRFTGYATLNLHGFTDIIGPIIYACVYFCIMILICNINISYMVVISSHFMFNILFCFNLSRCQLLASAWRAKSRAQLSPCGFTCIRAELGHRVATWMSRRIDTL